MNNSKEQTGCPFDEAGTMKESNKSDFEKAIEETAEQSGYIMTNEDYLNLHGWPGEPETEDQKIKKAMKQFIKEGGCV